MPNYGLNTSAALLEKVDELHLRSARLKATSAEFRGKSKATKIRHELAVLEKDRSIYILPPDDGLANTTREKPKMTLMGLSREAMIRKN